MNRLQPRPTDPLTRPHAPDGPDIVIVGTDAHLTDDALRIASAAGRQAVLVASLAEAEPLWQAARIVVVTGEVGAGVMSRRDHIIVITYDGSANSGAWYLAHQLGATHVAVLPEAEAWLVDAFDEAGSPSRARVISVMGARGGAGATTFATAVAVQAARTGHSVLLVDADVGGGGIDLALGAESVSGVRWRDLAPRSGRLPVSLLTTSLPERHGVHVLSHDRQSDSRITTVAAAAVLESACRAFEVVVIDLPRSADPVTALLIGASNAVALVVPRDVRSVAAATHAVGVLGPGQRPLLVTRGPAPGGVTGTDVAHALGLTLFAELGSDKGLAAELDRGEAPGLRDRSSLAQVSRRLLEAVMAPAAGRAAA